MSAILFQKLSTGVVIRIVCETAVKSFTHKVIYRLRQALKNHSKYRNLILLFCNFFLLPILKSRLTFFRAYFMGLCLMNVHSFYFTLRLSQFDESISYFACAFQSLKVMFLWEVMSPFLND